MILRIAVVIACLLGSIVLGTQAMVSGDGLTAVFALAALMFGLLVAIGRKAN